MKREIFRDIELALTLPILACPYYQGLAQEYGWVLEKYACCKGVYALGTA